MKDFSRTEFTKWGETRMVPVRTFTNRKEDTPAKRPWTKKVFVERGVSLEGALCAYSLFNETVLVVTRKDWMEAPIVRTRDENKRRDSQAQNK